MDNRINIFQACPAPERRLDLWIWFSEIHFRTAHGVEIDVADFIAGGDRWWTALYAGDDRVLGHGIVPRDKSS